MTREDFQSLYSKLEEFWPSKLKPEIKREFCERLERFPIDGVLKELARWKAEKLWPPKIHELIERLRKVGAATPEQMYRTVIAQGVAEANPRLNGRSETELIVRYHRYWFFRYRGSVSKHSDRDELVNARRAVLERQCFVTLMSVHSSREGDDLDVAEAEADATNAASWIDAERAPFEEFCRMLGDQPRPAVRADDEVPEGVATIFG